MKVPSPALQEIMKKQNHARRYVLDTSCTCLDSLRWMRWRRRMLWQDATCNPLLGPAGRITLPACSYILFSRNNVDKAQRLLRGPQLWKRTSNLEIPEQLIITIWKRNDGGHWCWSTVKPTSQTWKCQEAASLRQSCFRTLTRKIANTDDAEYKRTPTFSYNSWRIPCCLFGIRW